MVVGSLSYGDAASSRGALSPLTQVGKATTPAEADPAPWLAAAGNEIVDIADQDATNELVPTRVPAGWRQVARGVYATSAEPGRGAVVVVLHAHRPVAQEGARLGEVAAEQRRRWAPFAGIRTSVEVGPVFGRMQGLVRTHRSSRPLPNRRGTTSFSRVEVRSATVDSESFVAVGIDDVARLGSDDEVVAIVESLRPR